MKRTLFGCLLNINIPVVVCQYKLWYNNNENIADVKGVIMLFMDLIDILYLVVGVIIGACVMTIVDYLTCEDCKRREDYDE